MNPTEKMYKIGKLVIIGGIIGGVILQFFSSNQSKSSPIRIDKIPLNIDTQIQFNIENDCPYQFFLLQSYLYINFNVESHSSTGVTLSFYNEVEDGEYMDRVSICYARSGESCVLEVQTKDKAKYLVVNADKISKEKTSIESTGKFFWSCQVQYSYVSPNGAMALVFMSILVVVMVVVLKDY